MSYESIDTLQKALQEQVFEHTKDAKKAAGRALGTIVEIITYYLFKDWGLNDCMSIERGLPEYGNSDITHNVEFLLHPIVSTQVLEKIPSTPVTATKIIAVTNDYSLEKGFFKKDTTLITSLDILRNSCAFAENDNLLAIANLSVGNNKEKGNIEISLLSKKPFAMIECKRVGVEEGCKKGPQTIEKAKQGAYVAQRSSSLQKIWTDDGQRYGIIYNEGQPIIMPYNQLLETVIKGEELLKNFILSIGIVSNHGNWFTSENKNKELKVLAQSYDWLLFLTDKGLAQFVTDLLLFPSPRYIPVKNAFMDSYKAGKKQNIFTKTKIDKEAHRLLCLYFSEKKDEIEQWFNVISPDKHTIRDLKEMLCLLKEKYRRVIYDSRKES